MAVRVTKPAFNVREKLTELDLPKGKHGIQVLKSNSLKETCELVGSGRRNLLINGGFDVWQRGNTFTTPSAHYYAADRWIIYRSSNSHTTTTRESFNVGQSEVPGNPRHFMRVSNVPDPDSTWIEVAQHIEDVTQFSDKWVTLSFWMRANKPQENNEDYWALQYNFGTGGSPSSSYRVAMTPKFDVYTQWTYYEFPLYLADIQGKTIGTNGKNTSSLKVQLLRDSAVDNDTYYDFANVQLEFGRGATPFEKRSYGEELALCERYYEIISPGGGLAMWSWDNNSGGTNIFFKTKKRVIPTFTYTGTLSNNASSSSDHIGVYASSLGWRSWGNFSMSEASTDAVRIMASSMGSWSSGQSIGIYFYNNAAINAHSDFAWAI